MKMFRDYRKNRKIILISFLIMTSISSRSSARDIGATNIRGNVECELCDFRIVSRPNGQETENYLLNIANHHADQSAKDQGSGNEESNRSLKIENKNSGYEFPGRESKDSEKVKERGASIYGDDTSDEAASKRRRDEKILFSMEIAYQLLNFGDAVTTIDLLSRKKAQEANPILGKNPSTLAIAGLKAATAALHFMAYRHYRNTNPRKGFRLEAISIAVQGAITAANLRFYF